MENPQVTVFVKEYKSQRVTVEGAVREPGVHSLTGRTSLLQIIALSERTRRTGEPERNRGLSQHGRQSLRRRF